MSGYKYPSKYFQGVQNKFTNYYTYQWQAFN